MNTIENIMSRKTIRAYSGEPVASDAIETLIKAGAAAPTALGKFEALEICVIENADILNGISDTIEKNTGRKGTLYGAPVLFVICFDKTAPTADFAALNCACVAENIQLAANELGLGSGIQMASAGVIAADSELKKSLQIGDDYEPILSVCVGHATEEAQKAEKKAREVKAFLNA